MNLFSTGKQFKDERGAALPVAILAVMLLSILGGMLMSSINNEMKFTTATEDRIASKYIAEASIEHGIAALYDMLEEILKDNKQSPVSLNELDGYDTTQELAEGSYKYILIQGDLGFQRIEFEDEIGDITVYIILDHDTFIIRGSAIEPAFYQIEAEVNFQYNSTTKRIFSYDIIAWEEKFD